MYFFYYIYKMIYYQVIHETNTKKYYRFYQVKDNQIVNITWHLYESKTDSYIKYDDNWLAIVLYRSYREKLNKLFWVSDQIIFKQLPMC